MVTEPLLDAKGEAHQAEVRTDLAKTLLALEHDPYGLAGLIMRVVSPCPEWSSPPSDRLTFATCGTRSR